MSQRSYPTEIEKAAKMIMDAVDAHELVVNLTDDEKKALECDYTDEECEPKDMDEVLSPERYAAVKSDYEAFCSKIAKELMITQEQSENLCSSAW